MQSSGAGLLLQSANDKHVVAAEYLIRADEAPLRILLIRKTGEVLGTGEAADAHAAETVAAVQFELDEQQRRRLLVQEMEG